MVTSEGILRDHLFRRRQRKRPGPRLKQLLGADGVTAARRVSYSRPQVQVRFPTRSISTHPSLWDVIGIGAVLAGVQYLLVFFQVLPLQMTGVKINILLAR